MEKVIVKLNGTNTELDVSNIETLPNGDKKYILINGSTVIIPKESLNEGTSGKKLLLG
jgi:hypothetical protein